jgi:hypothetical protein
MALAAFSHALRSVATVRCTGFKIQLLYEKVHVMQSFRIQIYKSGKHLSTLPLPNAGATRISPADYTFFCPTENFPSHVYSQLVPVVAIAYHFPLRL